MEIKKPKRISIDAVIGIKCDCCGKEIPPETGYWHVEPYNSDYCTKECLQPQLDTYLFRSGSDTYSGNDMEIFIKHSYHHYRERNRKK